MTFLVRFPCGIVLLPGPGVASDVRVHLVCGWQTWEEDLALDFDFHGLQPFGAPRSVSMRFSPRSGSRGLTKPRPLTESLTLPPLSRLLSFPRRPWRC